MAFVNPYIRSALGFSPTIIERLVAKLPSGAFDARPDPDRFTVREAICHLADWEPFFLERLIGAVTIDNFRIVPYDEGQLAIDNDYANQDIERTLKRFRIGRSTYIAYVETLSLEDLDRPAYHPERGHLTAGDLIDMVVGHDVYHIEQISAQL
jgi:uncharacterized damage-inducible protein DinB